MLDQTGAGAGEGVSGSRGGGALREALRRARREAAEQADVVIDLRQAEIARLEALREELEPVFASVPLDIDIFDVGLAPGDRPRLFIDMVSFVEMGRDRRAYRFMRDGRHGRSLIVESDKTDPIVEAVTVYVARRLVERERLLTDDDRIADPQAFAGRAGGAAGPLQAAARAVAPPRPTDPAGETTTVDRHGPRADSEPEHPGAPPSAVRAGAPPAEEPPAPRSGWIGGLAKLILSFGVGFAVGAVLLGIVLMAIAKGLLPL